MGEVTTQLAYLDIKTILNNYKNDKLWNKVWVIFKNKELTVTWRLSSINIIDNTISSYVKVTTNKIIRGGKTFIDYDYNYCSSIPISNSDYKQETFIANILGTTLRTLHSIEQKFIKETSEYRNAKSLEDDENSTLREIAEDFLDENGVSNDEIREAYIDAYVWKHRVSYTTNIINNCQFHFFKSAYIHICSWFGSEKTFKEYVDKIGKKVNKKYIYDIWKHFREIQTEEWREEMKNELEDI